MAFPGIAHKHRSRKFNLYRKTWYGTQNTKTTWRL